MSETGTRVALLTPHRVEEAQAEGLAAAIKAACTVVDAAALVVRVAPADERSLVNLIKRLAPPAQAGGAAVLVACPNYPGDLVSVAARGGADGVHVDKADLSGLRDLRGRLRDGRILGAGGHDTKHAAMEAGEAGVDYVMFGGLYPDGAAPDPDLVQARAAWWAEIFETPCIAVASARDQVEALLATGAEFLGLESDLWMGGDADLAAIRARLSAPRTVA
ncbi:thiamine phosphate synthase [Methylobacterium iners]|uniref:Thiamine-phosphate synthase n=1 Tax=Methylobacterium iners TaxID=418707 RepID=A0ABQ4S113_9HYPH|nr:thiamine phosphate synthase [Methylobacterium iners]GJD95538.1 Thiamine-phosphate synthase [Methylobacterium iners]